MIAERGTTVATAVCATTLPAEFYAAYDIGSIEAITHLPKGRTNESYRLTTTTSEYVVRRSAVARTIGALQFEHDLMAHLASHDFPLPHAVKTRQGAPFLMIDNDLYRVTQYVDGQECRSTPAQVAAIGRTLARYHQIVSTSTSSNTKEGVAPLLTSLADGLSRLTWPGTGGDQPEGGPVLSARTAAAVQTIHAWLVATHQRLMEPDVATLPWLTIHASCRSSSVIFQGDQVVAMLDFDVAHPDWRIFDLAIAILDLAVIMPAKIALDLGLVQTFLTAYQSVEALTLAERALLPCFLRARILRREIGRYEAYRRAPDKGASFKLRRAANQLEWLAANEAAIVADDRELSDNAQPRDRRSLIPETD